jgi:acyl-CoA synthetase (AMP-forming)/AMP-acid ligase II
MLPSVRVWIRIETNRSPMPGAALSFEQLASAGDGSPLRIQRSPDDGYLQYTGGTTGRPKGVLWPTSQSRLTQLESPLLVKAPNSLEEHAEMVRSNPVPPRTIPASPLMHGSGSNAAIGDLLNGGSIILLRGDRFDPHELWRAAQRHRATRIALVGDVFAKSLLRALDDAPAPYDLASLRLITSSGLTWSQEVRAGLLERLPQIVLVDILAASEAAGLGYALSRLGDVQPTGLFKAGRHTVLVDPDRFEILPVAATSEGLLARDGAMATGYFGDAAKTAATFRVIDGKRYAIPGDMARWVPPDHLTMIGRGNLCINSGGEKIFPEEVEEALKLLPGIEDAIVIGCPDETWGKIVVAIVKITGSFDETEIRSGLSRNLAAYKQPKRYIIVTEMPRHETGKVDYQKAQTLG